MAKILIVTRTKNRTILLQRAIESVLAQTYNDWHHVIVNDGGNIEELERIVYSFRPDYRGRITIINNPKSHGMEHASNIGIKSQTSDLIAIHDDDDTWQPNFLERMINELESSHAQGVVCHINQKFETISNSTVSIIKSRYLDPLLNDSISYRSLEYKNLFLPISFIFKREVYEELDGYDERFDVCGDWDFHYRFLKVHRLVVIKERLANYHIRVGSFHGDRESKNSVKDKTRHNLFTNFFYEKHNIKTKIFSIRKIYDKTVLRIVRQLIRRILK